MEHSFFLEGQLVHTDNGLKEIQCINKGSKVLSHNSDYNYVSDIHKKHYRGYVNQIKIKGYGYINVLSGTTFYTVEHGDTTVANMNVDKLTKNHYLLLPFGKKYRNIENIFAGITCGYYRMPIEEIKKFRFDGTVYGLDVEKYQSYVVDGATVGN